MRNKYFCTDCDNEMLYTGEMDETEYNSCVEYDSLDWECPKCGAEGWLAWDGVNKESYIRIAKEYTYAEIYADPIGNQPDCCIGCNPAYPQCVTSCKIFND